MQELLSRTRAKCHPDRYNAGFGLCSKCYQKRKRKKLPRSKIKAHSKRMRAWGDAHRGQVALARRKWNLKSRYSLSWDDYMAMLRDQKDSCAICGRHFSTISSRVRGGVMKTVPDVDHVSRDGHPFVRGLLCGDCNKGIGTFKDDPVRLRSAADYIDRSAPDSVQSLSTLLCSVYPT